MAVVEYERRGHVAIITMNKPERLNAMGQELMQGLAGTWSRFRDDSEAWVGVFTGAGRAFCAGMDIKERVESGDITGRTMPAPNDPFLNGEIDKPTIAAVNGYALGGGFFFTGRCDLRVAAENAVFQITEVARSRLPNSLGVLVWENFPYAIAAELAAGATINARRAYEIGFVNKVVPLAQLLPTAIEMAEGLLNYPPLAVHYNLKLLRDLRNERGRLPLLLVQERERFQRQLDTTADMKESMLSFVEKRAPVYRRR